MDQPLKPGFRAGFAAILGRPNVGKSTLLNAFLQRKLSIVSAVPQTTRHKILGILNRDDCQACFLDTPGLLDAAKDGLQHALMRTARIASRDDADVLLLVVEPSLPSPQDLEALARLTRGTHPVLLAINKADAAPGVDALRRTAEAYDEAVKPAEIHVISALRKDGVEELLASVVSRLPESPPYYETDRISDRWERFFAEEVIREKIFEQYFEEIPHACATVVEEFSEAGSGPRSGPGRPGSGRNDRVSAIVYVERETQKGILIGAKGKAIRNLTETAQKALKDFLGRPVELDLRVKVRSNWRKDPRSLREFGFEGRS